MKYDLSTRCVGYHARISGQLLRLGKLLAGRVGQQRMVKKPNSCGIESGGFGELPGQPQLRGRARLKVVAPNNKGGTKAQIVHHRGYLIGCYAVFFCE